MFEVAMWIPSAQRYIARFTGTEQECWEYVTAQKICGDRQTTYLVWSQKNFNARQ